MTDPGTSEDSRTGRGARHMARQPLQAGGKPVDDRAGTGGRALRGP